MPYDIEFPKVQRNGILKLEFEFRNEDNELFEADTNTAILNINSPNGTPIIIDENLVKEAVGFYSYDVKPAVDWEFGLYTVEYKGVKDSHTYLWTSYFIVTNNPAFRQVWQIMTPERIIRDYLVGGIGLSYSDCENLDTKTIWQYIFLGIDKIERDIQVRLLPVSITATDVRSLINRESPTDGLAQSDIVEAPYDYHAFDYFFKWGFLQLREYPVIDITRMSLIYPTGQKIIDFPNQWIKIYHRKGQLQLVPTAGTIDATMIGRGGQFLPLMTGRLPFDIPQLIYIDYVAGLLTVSETYKDMVAKLACIDLLRITGEAITRGIVGTSASIDGLSQSVSFSSELLFQARINEYKEDYEQFKKDQKQRDKGIQMKVM